MRILHTSDLHIGKKLELRSRLYEQREVLKNIAITAKAEKVDVLLIAGDIYDSFTPPAEGERLFYDFLSMLQEYDIAVVVISGNHDDPARLTAACSLTSHKGIYFAGADTVITDRDFNGKVKFVDGGNDYFIFEKDGEKVCFTALPYPTELRMREKVDETERYEDKVKRYILEAFSKNQGLPTVLVGHIFMLGGQKGDSERDIDLGGARILSKNVIPKECIYTALGHLHKRQIVDSERNILYSGSIIPYAFDETGLEKSVTIFDVKDGKAINLKTVETKGYKPLYKLHANSIEEGETLVKGINGYIELTLNLDAPITNERMKEFLSDHPDVSLRLIFNGGEGEFRSDRRALSNEELFKAYYDYRFSSEPDQKVLELFLSIMNKIEVGDETEKT